MKRIAEIISWLALAGTLLPALLFFSGTLDLPQVKLSMTLSMVAWFVATPLWMEHEVS